MSVHALVVRIGAAGRCVEVPSPPPPILVLHAPISDAELQSAPVTFADFDPCFQTEHFERIVIDGGKRHPRFRSDRTHDYACPLCGHLGFVIYAENSNPALEARKLSGSVGSDVGN